MANNYRSGCVEISSLTDEEYKWLSSVANLLLHHSGNFKEELVQLGFDLNPNFEDQLPGFKFDILQSRDSSKVESVYFEGDEYLNEEIVADIIQQFLIKFRPSEYIYFEYADHCSKLRPGQFGGGAVFVTAKYVHYTHTFEWVQEQIEKFKSENSEQ